MKIEKLIEEINSNEEYRSFLELKDKMAKRGINLDKKFAIFKDEKGDFNIVEIYINIGQCFMLNSKNQQGENTGYMNIYFHPNMRFFLDTIYCYDAFRGRKIASNLSEIADYIMQKYQGYKIRGVYEPGQLSTDRINNITRDKEELEKRADNFYQSMGYKKINYKDFREHPERYTEIDENLDFQLGEEIPKTIIVKDVIPKQQYPFKIINGVLVNKNAFEREKDIEER